MISPSKEHRSGIGALKDPQGQRLGLNAKTMVGGACSHANVIALARLMAQSWTYIDVVGVDVVRGVGQQRVQLDSMAVV